MPLEINEFKQTVWKFYKENGRDDLPWRKTTDPYSVLVSEIMLQQTQVSRVIPKYIDWLDQFPDFPTLAEADLSSVIALWQGLGYNRRARYLAQTAEDVMTKHDGSLPENEESLKKLPGIGPYTAGAVQAFAYNTPVVFVDTNIRSVYLYHFFEDQNEVNEALIEEHVKQTLDTQNPREWYWALMDYGAFIKDEYGNPNKKSSKYNTQSKFEGSNRQLRSRLLRFILNNQPADLEEIKNNLQSSTERQKSIEDNLNDLVHEKMIEKTNQNTYRVAN